MRGEQVVAVIWYLALALFVVSAGISITVAACILAGNVP